MFFYNTGIIFYLFIIRIASFFNKKAKLWYNGRKNIFDKLEAAFKNNEGKVIWVHCASLGEFEQGRPFIEYIKSSHPDYKILLTFFSPSGYEVRKNYEHANYIFYLPADTAKNAQLFISIVKPERAFFVKYEFWYHYINELSKNNIPIYSISAIFRKEQLFFKAYGGFYRDILKKFTAIYVQNSESKALLESIGVKSTVAGDTRFDRVKSITDNKKELPFVKRFKKDSRLFVIGSSWSADIEVLLPTINELYLERSTVGNIKFIIAPHEIDTKEIALLQKKILRASILHSQLEKQDLSLFDVLIIDNVGMLSSIYAYADFAYIGGAFGKGLHNILEAATFGMPIFFGPNFTKFQEAVDLVAQGGAFSIDSTKEFDTLFKQVASDENYHRQCCEVTKSYVESNVGATQTIVGSIQL